MSNQEFEQEALDYLDQMMSNTTRLLRMCKANPAFTHVVMGSLGATLATVAVAARHDFNIAVGEQHDDEFIMPQDQQQEVVALNLKIKAVVDP